MPLTLPRFEIPAGEFTFTFPPADAWMAYIYVVVILVFLRLILLTGPYDALIRKYAPHAGGLLRQMFRLRKITGLRGLYALGIRELFTLVMPPLFTLGFRLTLGHPGRVEWNTISEVIFGAFVIVWVILDVLRILKTRRSINALVDSRWSRPKAMKRVMSTFGWSLETLSSLANMGGEELSSEVVDPVESGWAASAAKKSWMLLKRTTKKSAIAAKDAIDSKVQKTFKSNTKMQWRLLFADMMLSFVPLSLLYLLSYLLS
jgi:hypothetical protein